MEKKIQLLSLLAPIFLFWLLHGCVHIKGDAALIKDTCNKTEIPSFCNSLFLDNSSSLTAGQKMIVVSQDGRGHFRHVNDALNSISGQGRVVVNIKEGIYEEYFSVIRENITFLGDGIGKTVLQSRRSNTNHYSIKDSAALNVLAKGFIAINMSFNNIAGPENGQAVALRSSADRLVFYRCSITGYQDTLLVDYGSQFFKDCDIEGTVDFIFGDAAVVFQNCTIKLRRPLKGQANVITAQGREVAGRNTGISIQGCQITVAEAFSAKSYLGRPWRNFSRTTVIQSRIDGCIDPVGWTPWEGNKSLDTLVYREYGNYGPGAATTGRVRWPGYKVMGAEEAGQYTVARLIDGQAWINATGIPFILFL